MAKLTKKQQTFVEEYLIDLNATQAAIRAGYSVQRASEIGYQLLQKTTVQTAIAKAMAKRSKRTGINQDRIVIELAKIAFVNITDIVNDDCEIKNNATDEDLACIESIKVKQFPTKSGDLGIEREVKLSPKMKALELLGKHLGMWNDKLDVNLNIPVVISGEDELEE
jgi:phage terminase small subunit